MTNYFKVYITGKNKIKKYTKIKQLDDVIDILNSAKQDGCISYSIIKRTKQGTDISLISGNFEKELDVESIKGKLNVDIRIVTNEYGGKVLVNMKTIEKDGESEKER